MDAATLNLILFAILAVFALNGLRRGFLLSLYDLLALALILALATEHNQEVGAVATRQLGLPPIADAVLGYVIILVLGELARFLGSFVLRAIAAPMFRSAPALRFFDHAAGLVPGLARGLAILSVVFVLLQAVSLEPGLIDAAKQLPLGRAIVGAKDLVPLVPEISAPALSAPSSLLTSPSPTAVPRTTTVSIDPKDEAALLAMTNLARTQAGLPGLIADGRLVNVAREHSLEMYRQGYFAHDSPTLGSPTDRLTAAGIAFRAAGENLAYAPTIEEAFRGLMASPEHRQNILSTAYTHIGIGVARSDVFGVVVTEDFTN